MFPAGQHRFAGAEQPFSVRPEHRQPGSFRPPPSPAGFPGDILVFHGAGAYSRSMASNYGGSLRCPEILLEDGVPRLIRRREVVKTSSPAFSEVKCCERKAREK